MKPNKLLRTFWTWVLITTLSCGSAYTLNVLASFNLSILAFNNFDLTADTAAATYTFEAGSTQTINSTLAITGAAGSLINIYNSI